MFENVARGTVATASTPTSPPASRSAGSTSVCGAFTRHPGKLAFDAANCLRVGEERRSREAEDGLPPTRTDLRPDPKVRKAYPFADMLFARHSRTGSARPVSPAYNDISLAVQRTLHPPASGIEPGGRGRAPRRRWTTP